MNGAMQRTSDFAADTNMTNAGRYETGDDTTSSYNQTKELLQANPDIVAIQGSASTDVVGAAQAVEELGLTGKVAVVGTSMTSIARQFVESWHHRHLLRVGSR